MSSVHQVFLAVIRRFLKANFKKSIVLSYDKNRQVSYETCRFLILFSCFFANLVFEQDSHVVPTAIQNTVNVDVVPVCPVENHIASADKEAIIAVYICDGGKRCADQRMVTEQRNQALWAADHHD